MTKYREYFLKMIEENKSVFADFQNVHDAYSLDEKKWQEKFNLEGAKVLDIVRDYENKLCRQTEKGMYNVFSPKLSEKFYAEIQKRFPLFDHIGLKVEPDSDNEVNTPDDFVIKKITPH